MKNTLPWSDDGWRLLPTANYFHYHGLILPLGDRSNAAVRHFRSLYPGLRAEAPALLNGMFDETDYPSPEEVSRNFNFSLEPRPVPRAGDFRVDLSADVVEDMRARSPGRSPTMWKGRLRTAGYACTVWLITWSSGSLFPTNHFKDSLVGNISRLVEVLPRLNITHDQDLEKCAGRWKHVWHGFRPGSFVPTSQSEKRPPSQPWTCSRKSTERQRVWRASSDSAAH